MFYTKFEAVAICFLNFIKSWIVRILYKLWTSKIQWVANFHPILEQAHIPSTVRVKVFVFVINNQYFSMALKPASLWSEKLFHSKSLTEITKYFIILLYQDRKWITKLYYGTTVDGSSLNRKYWDFINNRVPSLLANVFLLHFYNVVYTYI